MIADGPPSRLVESAIDGAVDLIVPAPVVREPERVVELKLGFDDDRCAEARDLLDRIAPHRPSPPRVIEHVTRDPDDDEILACAVEASADVIVSGDRGHLLPHAKHRELRILAPQALLAELQA